MISRPLASRFWLLMVGLLAASPLLAQNKIPLAAELERLAKAHGFTLVGGQVVGEEALGRPATGDLYPSLRKLLVDYDHIIVQAPGGGVERVIILGEKTAQAPSTAPPSPGASAGGGHIELKTRRSGTQHLVQVSLEGEGGKRLSRELLVDTGADFVVLPASLVKALGIKEEGLGPSEMQTANGKVQSRVGNLPAIWLGQSRIENVRTVFLDDAKLGNSGLLGMSVLGRFTLTIDDKAGRLTLDPKGGAKPGAPAGTAPAAASPQTQGQGAPVAPEAGVAPVDAAAPTPEQAGQPVPEAAPPVPIAEGAEVPAR